MKISEIPSTEKLYARSIKEHALDTLPKYLEDAKKFREGYGHPFSSLSSYVLKPSDDMEKAISKLLSIYNICTDKIEELKTLQHLCDDLVDRFSKYEKIEILKGCSVKKRKNVKSSPKRK